MLNVSLDLNALAIAYSERQRLSIRNVLEDESAERVERALNGEVPWGVAFNSGAKVAQLTGTQAGALTAEQRRAIVDDIHERARDRFQFFYDYFPLSRAFLAGDRPSAALSDLFMMLNSPACLDAVRRITGLHAIRWADAHATRYRAGHFLTHHTDENAAEHRLAAYVLNFTRSWGRDWGGHLQFFDADGNVEQSYRPQFNAVNIFSVPADHSVGMVAGYCRASRLSVTGWFRADARPGGLENA